MPKKYKNTYHNPGDGISVQVFPDGSVTVTLSVDASARVQYNVEDNDTGEYTTTRNIARAVFDARRKAEVPDTKTHHDIESRYVRLAIEEMLHDNSSSIIPAIKFLRLNQKNEDGSVLGLKDAKEMVDSLKFYLGYTR